MNLESTNTIGLLSAIAANTEQIAVIQNDLSVLVESIRTIQHEIARDNDQVWGQIREVHSLLESMNDNNEYYCNRCHDLLIIVAGLVFMFGLFAIIGRII